MRHDRAIAERALHQRGFLQPGLEIVAEHVLVEQRGHVCAGRVCERPHGHRIIIGDETERLQP